VVGAVAPAPQNTPKTQAKERPEKLLLLVLFLCVFAGGTMSGKHDPWTCADGKGKGHAIEIKN